ncbi:hypothetical protein ABW21_db0206093 [Orbilia brochopaga]|nr:hypothetical protein ABW21_db0206093 [Drechslerella brochopaga]
MGTGLSIEDALARATHQRDRRHHHRIPELVLPPDPDAEFDFVGGERHRRQEAAKLGNRNNYKLSPEEQEECDKLASEFLLKLPSTGDVEKDKKRAKEKAKLEFTWNKTEALFRKVREDQQWLQRSSPPPAAFNNPGDPNYQPVKKYRTPITTGLGKHHHDDAGHAKTGATRDRHRRTGENAQSPKFSLERIRAFNETFKTRSADHFHVRIAHDFRKKIQDQESQYHKEAASKRKRDPWYRTPHRPRQEGLVPSPWVVNLVYDSEELLKARPERRQAMVLHNEYLRFCGIEAHVPSS